MKKRLAALALCLALLQLSCLARTASPQAAYRAGPSPRHRAPFSLRHPLPTYGFMHARVIAGPLPVYGNRLLEGEPLGQLAAGDFTTVEIYTQGVGRVTGASAELFGGFVRLAPLEELPDEHDASYDIVRPSCSSPLSILYHIQAFRFAARLLCVPIFQSCGKNEHRPARTVFGEFAFRACPGFSPQTLSPPPAPFAAVP